MNRDEQWRRILNRPQEPVRSSARKELVQLFATCVLLGLFCMLAAAAVMSPFAIAYILAFGK